MPNGEAALPMISSKTDPVLALCGEYFFACKVLRDHLNEIKDQCLADPKGIDDHLRARFCTYLNHWLSSLFVVADGFRNTLKLNDSVITQLIDDDDNLMYKLRQFRNATHHFNRRPDTKRAELFMTERDALNWAQNLHLEFERYFLEYTSHLESATVH
jgi:hypothetical protein